MTTDVYLPQNGALAQLPLNQRLGMAVALAARRPFYLRHWGADSIESVINSVHNGGFTQLPIMRKSDLRSKLNQIVDGFEAVDIVSSSGTTGRPVDIPVHAEQEQGRVRRVQRLLRELGCRPGMTVLQLLSLNDLFTLGVLSWQAIKAEGATAIRCSPGRLDRILDAIYFNKPQIVIGNPYVMNKLAREAGPKWPAAEILPDRAFFAVASTFFPDLSLTPVAANAIKLWGLKQSLNQYGTSEVGPIAYETRAHDGLHVHHDYNYVELLDPVTGQTVPEGSSGEVVVTGLSFPRGFLPVRYATGDVAGWLKTQHMDSGETRQTLGPIIGRTDHQLKIMGQTVFPDLLLEVADQVHGVDNAVVTVVRDPHLGDITTILCVAQAGVNCEDVVNAVRRGCEARLAVAPHVRSVSAGEVEKLQTAALKKTNGSKIPRFFTLHSQDSNS